MKRFLALGALVAVVGFVIAQRTMHVTHINVTNRTDECSVTGPSDFDTDPESVVIVVTSGKDSGLRRTIALGESFLFREGKFDYESTTGTPISCGIECHEDSCLCQGNGVPVSLGRNKWRIDWTIRKCRKP